MDDATELINAAPKAWRRYPIADRSKYLACRVTPGADWWDIDDALQAITGRRSFPGYSTIAWHLVPVSSGRELAAALDRYAGRVKVHRILE